MMLVEHDLQPGTVRSSHSLVFAKLVVETHQSIDPSTQVRRPVSGAFPLVMIIWQYPDPINDCSTKAMALEVNQ